MPLVTFLLGNPATTTKPASSVGCLQAQDRNPPLIFFRRKIRIHYRSTSSTSIIVIFVWVCLLCTSYFYFQAGVEEVCGKIRVKVHWESETLASSPESPEDKPRLFLRDVFGPDQRVRVRLGNDSQPQGHPSVNRVF